MWEQLNVIAELSASFGFVMTSLRNTLEINFCICLHVLLQSLDFDKIWYRGKKGKGKFRPRKVQEGTEGEYTYSSTLSLTSILDGSGSLTPRPGRFTSGNKSVAIVISYIYKTFQRKLLLVKVRLGNGGLSFTATSTLTCPTM